MKGSATSRTERRRAACSPNSKSRSPSTTLAPLRSKKPTPSRSLTNLDTVAFGMAVRRAISFTPRLVSWGSKAARSAEIRRTTDVEES